MELYGSKATLHVPDPNFFGGELRVATSEEQRQITLEHPFARINDEEDDGTGRANYRGAGLADMIAAIEQGRVHRCNDTLALHVVEIMSGVLQAAATGQAVTVQGSCSRPAALDADAARALLA
jgi:predicted dehydrogenase